MQFKISDERYQTCKLPIVFLQIVLRSVALQSLSVWGGYESVMPDRQPAVRREGKFILTDQDHTRNPSVITHGHISMITFPVFF